MKRKVFQEIMERAMEEVREALDEGGEETGAEEWNPDAWEAEVRQFTQQLGQGLLQVWAEVKTEQAQAQVPFAPAAAKDPSCTDGSPSGG